MRRVGIIFMTLALLVIISCFIYAESKLPTDPVDAVEQSVHPVYPKEVANEDVEGTVWLKILLEVNGDIHDVEVVQTSGDDRLDEAAINTIKNEWSFKSYPYIYKIELKICFKDGDSTIEFRSIDFLSGQAKKTSKQQYDFKNINWGISEEQVIVIENKWPDYEECWFLGFDTEIDDIDTVMSYFFYNDKLGAFAYTFKGTKDSYDDGYYISEYQYINLKNLLVKKYGEPIEDTIVEDEFKWRNALYKNKLNELIGFALYQIESLSKHYFDTEHTEYKSREEFLYYAIWETKNTYILINVKSDYGGKVMGVLYISKDTYKEDLALTSEYEKEIMLDL